jgi:holo-[acyl-carrier protein] synthase
VSEGLSSSLEPGLALGNAAVGVDVVGISAFAEQLAAPGTRFARVFTPGERRAARRGPEDGGDSSSSLEAQSLAARWAAKEAVIKAWSSTCFGHPEVIDPESVDLREIEVRTDAWGRPAIRLHGAIAHAMTGYDVLVSLSHDPAADVAVAFVVLQTAVPPAR